MRQFLNRIFSPTPVDVATPRIMGEHLKAVAIASQIVEEIARRSTLDELLANIGERINREFDDIYHTQVFLTDDSGTTVRLVASTGSLGEMLVERNHTLAVGGQSVIGRATVETRPVIARIGTRDSLHRHNELLPKTKVEAAFPLRIGDTIIGALDLHSKNAAAFPSETVNALIPLTNSIALAIDSTRQFQRAEDRVRENQRLVEETRRALHEVERLNERLTGRAWSEYLRGQGIEFGIDIDFDQNATRTASDWTGALNEAIRSNLLVQNQEADRQIIAVPLRVRGQVIGAMEFELDAHRHFTSDDFNLVQEVSERAGLAAENTRLLQASQRAAQREAIVNEINNRLQSANNVETTLAEAARSLRDVLKTEKVAIRLGKPPAGTE